MIQIKPGVDWSEMDKRLVRVAEEWHAIQVSRYGEAGAVTVVTSCREGVHSPPSFHYVGRAIDFRTRDTPDSEVEEMAALLRGTIGRRYAVVIKTNPKHLHVQLTDGG